MSGRVLRLASTGCHSTWSSAGAAAGDGEAGASVLGNGTGSTASSSPDESLEKRASILAKSEGLLGESPRGASGSLLGE